MKTAAKIPLAQSIYRSLLLQLRITFLLDYPAEQRIPTKMDPLVLLVKGNVNFDRFCEKNHLNAIYSKRRNQL